VSRRKHIENGSISSVRQASAESGVSPFVLRGWIARGLVPGPPWTIDQLHHIRKTQAHRKRSSMAAHGTTARWNQGCSCTTCRRAHSDIARANKRAKAQARLPLEVRQQLLDAIYVGQPFRQVLRDLGRTSNTVWGLTRTDESWSTALDAALTATRQEHLEHGTNAAYVAGCACRECREHQRIRMARNR
jgi:hypothetical protein